MIVRATPRLRQPGGRLLARGLGARPAALDSRPARWIEQRAVASGCGCLDRSGRASTPLSSRGQWRALSTSSGKPGGEQTGASCREAHCWSCGKRLNKNGFFCDECGSLKDPETLTGSDCDTTYFDLFNLEHKFDVDVRKLERQYWDIQKKLHPDRFGNKSLQEQEFSAANAALLNSAYSTLKSPLERAIYLLEQQGIDSLSEGGKTETDMEVLMWAMEQREALEESDQDKSGASLKRIFDDVVQQLAAVEVDLAEAFSKNDLDLATKLTIRLKYIDKMREECVQRAQDAF